LIKETGLLRDDETGDIVWADYWDSGFEDAKASFTEHLLETEDTVSTQIKTTQHSVDITPAMRSEVKRGLPLFQLGDKGETKINLENWKKIGAAVFAQKGDMLKADFKNALLKVINAQRFKAGLELWEEIGLSPKQLDDIYKAGKEYYKQLKESQKVKKVNSEEKVEKPEPVEKPKDKTEDVKSVTENVSNEPKPTGLKQRRFAKQVMESPDISDEIKKGLKNTMYDPISNKQSFADAKKMIETEGVQGAIDEIKNKDSEYDQRTRNMATVILTKTLSSEADKLMKAGEEEEAKKLYEKAISIIDVPQEELRTQLGQAIQVLSLFKYGTPEGALYAATKLKKKRDKGTKEKVKGEIEILKKKIDELQKKLAGEVVKEPKIKEKLTAAEKLAKKVEGSLEPPEPKETDPVAHLVQTLYDVIREKGLVPKFEENPTKEKLIELVGKAVKNDKGYEKVWDEAKEIVKNDFIDNAEALEVLDKYFAENHENPFTNAQIEKVVNKGIKEKEINLTELVKKHFSFAEESKRSLTEKLIQDAGLQPDEAGKLARAIEAKFEELATLRKRKILDNRFKEKNTEIKDRIQLFEKVIELSNLGALNDADYTKAFAEHLNTGPITPEQAAKIVELANKVQETPEGWQQDRAITDLYVYIEEMNGLDNTQVLWAMYYPAILSGVTTQFRNIFGNTFSLAAEAINRNVTDYPMGAVVLAKGLYRGMVEGAMVLKEGYGQNIGHMNKFSESVNQLVMDKHKFTTFGGGNANPVNAYLNSLKYVSRFLVAQDKVFYMGLKELEEYSLAKIIAKKEGLKGKALSARVKEILGNDPSKIELAKETATAEGLKGFNYKRRVWELVEKQRPADIVAEADSFASRGTFNYEPKGMIGEIAKGIQRFQRNKAGKYTKFIVPFTNIVANVLNNALDFAPIYGHKRWWWGYSGTEGRDAEPRTQRQKDQQLFRANVGMALFGALLTGVLNGLISVTTVGTGNNDKNKQLRETGWRPYSVKIGDKWYSYMGTPLAVPFIVAGGVHDMMHYKKDWDEQTFAQTFSASVFLSAGAIMDMSFLSSAKDFMTIFDPRSENKGESWGKRFIAQVPSAFVPNIAKQTARLFDNNQYEANTITEMLLRNVGIAQDKFGLKQKINILGQPIKKDALFETIGPPFGISETNEPVWNYLIKNSAYVSVPNKNTVIYDTELGKDRAMTSDEYYTYVKKSGEKIRTILEKNLSELEKLDSESARIFVRKLTDDARDNTRQEMFAPKTDESINAYDFDAKFNMDKIMVNLKIDKYDLRDENGKSVNYTPSKDEFEEGKIDMDRVEEKLYAHIDKLDDALEDKKISEEYRNREIDKLNELLKEYGWATIGK
jgi:hypothetical protein